MTLSINIQRLLCLDWFCQKGIHEDSTTHRNIPEYSKKSRTILIHLKKTTDHKRKGFGKLSKLLEINSFFKIFPGCLT